MGKLFAGVFFADVPKDFAVNADPFGCSAKLLWNTPLTNSCPITRYTIHYRESTTSKNNEGTWKITSLKESNITEYRLWLNCSKNYDIIVIAWNRRGHNDYDEKSVLSVLTEEGTYL